VRKFVYFLRVTVRTLVEIVSRKHVGLLILIQLANLVCFVQTGDILRLFKQIR